MTTNEPTYSDWMDARPSAFESDDERPAGTFRRRAAPSVLDGLTYTHSDLAGIPNRVMLAARDNDPAWLTLYGRKPMTASAAHDFEILRKP